MKQSNKRNLKHLIIAICIHLVCIPSIAGNSEKPFVVPEIKEWKNGKGILELNKNMRIVYSEKQPQLQPVAEMMADDCLKMFGWKPSISTTNAHAGDIVLELKNDKKLAEEGYIAKVADKVVLMGKTPQSIYWATRTILQISETYEGFQLPKGEIRDYPDYPIRGFMLDCGRKFIPMGYLKDLVKVMAYYKMNTLQIHLNDNGFKQYFEHDWNKTYSAFRLECDTYPGLAAHDGHYTKKEFIEFQKEALQLGVEIIPEIDVPAHALAFTQYMPQLGSQKYGFDHLDLFAPETYPFIDALFKEYLEGDEPVFCGRRVHVGTDEYSNETQDLIEKFRDLTDHCIKLVESYNKQACVWGALTYANGQTPVKSENVIMNLWAPGFANPQDMIDQGYQLISMNDWDIYIVPGAFYYNDYLKEEKLYNNWTPASIGKKTFEDKHPSILGGMFAVWNDLVGNGITVKDIHHRTFSSMQTLATKMWTGQNTTLHYDEYNTKRTILSEAPGVNQLARIGSKPSLVFETASVDPGSQLPLQEIGYNYTINFDLNGKEESPGTILFQSDNATFYLADPISGCMAFARDGYLNTFRYKVQEGTSASIQIEGDAISTTLKVNGKLIDKMTPQMRYFNCGKDSMLYHRTLVFPLEQAGNYNSQVSHLKIYNYCQE